MLLEFSVSNFLSIKDRVTLDLAATAISDFKDSNVIQTERQNILKGAVIYGANSSGKSNLIRAMSTMRRIVLHSFDQPSTAELDIVPFLLSTTTENEASFFEVLFLIGDARYRYGFELDNLSVRAEWLFRSKAKVEKPLFVRENDGIEVFSAFKEGKNLEARTRSNALFLNVVDQFNGPIAKEIMNWFSDFIVISGLSHEPYKAVTFDLLENREKKPLLEQFYTDLDLGFDRVNLNSKDFDPAELPSDLPEELVKLMVSDFEGQKIMQVRTLHRKFDENNEAGGFVEFDLRTQESSGTNKLFNLSGPVFEVLNDGGVLVVDELDASLHPLLTLAVTRLFNSVEHNPHNAQLIFATHDTNLLSFGNYRRDQIYFVEKNRFGASDLYSLVAYKEEEGKVRKDRSFEKDYINGRYGAIPFLGDISKVLEKWLEK